MYVRTRGSEAASSRARGESQSAGENLFLNLKTIVTPGGARRKRLKRDEELVEADKDEGKREERRGQQGRRVRCGLKREERKTREIF